MTIRTLATMRIVLLLALTSIATAKVPPSPSPSPTSRPSTKPSSSPGPSPSPSSSTADLEFLDTAHLPHHPVLCEAPSFCFYCPLATAIGTPFYVNHANTKATQNDINHVGLKCLKSLYKSPYGLLLNDHDYVALGVVDPYSEGDASYKSMAILAQKKTKLIDNLVCRPKKDKSSRQDSSYCSACARVGSPQCKRTLETLCEAGFSSANSGYRHRTLYNYKVNFLWKRLKKDAPRICKIVLSRTSYRKDNEYAFSTLAQVIVDQCESERRYKPCRASYETGHYDAPKEIYYEPRDNHHHVLLSQESGSNTYTSQADHFGTTYQAEPQGYSHKDTRKPQGPTYDDFPHDTEHSILSAQPHFGGYEDNLPSDYKVPAHEHKPYDLYTPISTSPHEHQIETYSEHPSKENDVYVPRTYELYTTTGYGEPHKEETKAYSLSNVHEPYKKLRTHDQYAVDTFTPYKEERSPQEVSYIRGREAYIPRKPAGYAPYGDEISNDLYEIPQPQYGPHLPGHDALQYGDESHHQGSSYHGVNSIHESAPRTQYDVHDYELQHASQPDSHDEYHSNDYEYGPQLPGYLGHKHHESVHEQYVPDAIDEYGYPVHQGSHYPSKDHPHGLHAHTSHDHSQAVKQVDYLPHDPEPYKPSIVDGSYGKPLGDLGYSVEHPVSHEHETYSSHHHGIPNHASREPENYDTMYQEYSNFFE